MVEGCRTIGKRSGSETSIANSSARTRGSIALAGSLSRQEKQKAVQRWIVQIVFSPSTPRKSGIEASEPHRGQWGAVIASRSEEHTSELQSLMRISYAVFCLNKTKNSS